MHQDGLTLQSEVNAVLKKLGQDATYGTKFYEAVDADDRKEVISLLKAGGIQKDALKAWNSFPATLR